MSPRYYNASIRNLMYRLRRFKDDLPELLEEAVMENEIDIVSAIADDQLFRRGITGKGVKIMDYEPYTARTIKKKKKKGQPTTRVTLKDTGKFHYGMRVVYEEGGFRITSDDSKTEELVERYGEDIFRLTDKNFSRLLNKVRKYLQKKLKQRLRGI